jgi:multidrug resistance efflux pump
MTVFFSMTSVRWPVLLMALMSMFPGQTIGAQADDPVLEPCAVKAQEDIRLPAEEAGVLIKLPWKEGALVQKGDLLASINDLQAKAGLEIAEIGLQSAKKRAESDIEVRYAQKASKVALADWEQDMAANRRTPGAVSEADLRRKKLDYERLELQIEKAQNDDVLAKYEVKTKAAELKAAHLALERREIRAPFDGEIVNLYRHESEWLSPGDPILRLVRFDTLHVEGYIDSSRYNPEQIDGRPVTIEVILAREKKIEATGKIIYVSQQVQGDRRYLIRAEIPNRRQGKYWLFRPGLKASMTIHLK